MWLMLVRSGSILARMRFHSDWSVVPVSGLIGSSVVCILDPFRSECGLAGCIQGMCGLASLVLVYVSICARDFIHLYLIRD